MKNIKLRVTTESNLFIGGMPTTFEIGGVDLYTIEDYEHQPMIPASSLKGALRRIVQEWDKEDDAIKKITEGYKKYLTILQGKYKENLEKLGENIEKERLKKAENRFEEVLENVSAEYLFGIQGFNDTPKLIFNDLRTEKKEEHWASLDSKNSIEIISDEIRSNPRTYKTVRPGISFIGEIQSYRLDELKVEGLDEFVERAMSEFNQGIYRLGNSGSRGYGRINVKILPEEK